MTSPPDITVTVSVRATAEQAWQAFTNPDSIRAWNFASPDWHCPQARNELRDGGAFCYRMEARDGSFGFDFEGVFLEVSAPTRLRYGLGPEREVLVVFSPEGDRIRVSQSFTPEPTHDLEQQRAGWQSILDHYRRHVEAVAGTA
jgi:uncharacterized protein YndB with AHSA1/START domain